MKALWQFISIIVLGFILITVYSFTSYEFKVGSFSLKKSNVKDFFMPTDSAESEMFVNIEILSEDVKKDTIIVDTTSQRILLIGDSMLEGLSLRLKQYTAHNKHKIKTVIWYSSQTKWYGESDTLRYYIKRYKPTYVMLVLGANELFVRNIKTKRLKYVKKIISQLDTVPYTWVGPPNWKDDTGINDLIIENVGEDHYFPSKNLTYRRYKDGAHPTHSSAAIWMDSIASWIQTKSYYRIKLEKPTKKYKVSANTTLLQPLR